MSKVISPVIALRVWYWPSEAGDARSLGRADLSGPMLAHVIAVHTDRLVDIEVRDHFGRMHSIANVILVQEGDDQPASCYCDLSYLEREVYSDGVAATGPGPLPALSPAEQGAAVEQLIVAKGKTGPRVTPADLHANIVDTEIVKHVSHSGQILRWAVLTTRSGFAVTGRPSAAVSAENDDPEIGVATAIDNARSELWPLMGYALKDRLKQQFLEKLSRDTGLPID